MLGSWRRRSTAERASACAAALVGVAAIVEAARHTWVADDIFITFRYCDNLLAGHGAVYNLGERSEGYTHFLWFVLLTVGRALGIDAEHLGSWLALPAFIGSLVWLVRISARLWPGRGGLWGFPVAMLAWALHEDARRFGSGGLETMAFTWALLVGVEALLHGDPVRRARIAAWAFAIATLLRPDGLLYSALAAGWVAWTARGQRAAVRDFVVVWVLLVAPVFAFRLAYYGWLLPNPYYAKSGGGAHWSQGWIYTRLYFGCYWALLAAPLAVAAIWADRREDTAARQRAGVLVFLAVAATATILYVTRVGGDFMFARFFLPVTPFLLLLVEAAVQALPRPAWRFAATILCCGLMVYGVARKHAALGQKRNVAGIVDEPQFYPRDRLANVRKVAAPLSDCLHDTHATMFVGGGQAALAYYARYPIAIERFGLTDATIAHQPLLRRGRPGHEKMATPEYIYRRGVNLRLLFQPLRSVPQYTLLRLAGLDGDIVIYDRVLMEHLKTCAGAQFFDFPRWLAEQYIPSIPTRQPRRLIADWGQFQHFYFNHNPDPEGLRERLRTALAQAGITALPDSLPPVFAQDPALMQP